MFLLAPDGYRYLGFDDAELPVPRNDPFTDPSHSQYFPLGMKGQDERSGAALQRSAPCGVGARLPATSPMPWCCWPTTISTA